MSKTLGLDENKIIEISKIKKEPKWMTDFRLNSYKAFRKISNPAAQAYSRTCSK